VSAVALRSAGAIRTSEASEDIRLSVRERAEGFLEFLLSASLEPSERGEGFLEFLLSASLEPSERGEGFLALLL
jgi:hypothetical protein